MKVPAAVPLYPGLDRVSPAEAVVLDVLPGLPEHVQLASVVLRRPTWLEQRLSTISYNTWRAFSVPEQDTGST